MLKWLKQNQKLAGLIALVILLISGLTALITQAAKAADFWPSFSLNLLTELMGAVITAIILGQVMDRALRSALEERARRSWDEFDRKGAILDHSQRVHDDDGQPPEK